jgi:magnesium transporter
MAEAGPVTLAYLSAHPGDAARLLETLSPEDLAAFLARVPVRLGAPPLAMITPWRAARCLALMEAERAALLVAEMPPDRRAPCLRAMPDRSRSALLEHMPAWTARGLRAQLTYPANLVGGIMASEVAAVAVGATADEAIAAVRTAGASDVVQVFLLEEGRRPVAAVPAAALLGTAGTGPALALARGDAAPLPADTPLGQVSSAHGWEDSGERPVVDARGRLVGRVTLAHIVRATDDAAAPVSHGPAPAAVVTRALLGTLGGLARAGVGLASAPGGTRRDD